MVRVVIDPGPLLGTLDGRRENKLEEICVNMGRT